MDDLKNLVIQTLEEEGTLGNLRAQLRARVFKAIEKNAEPAAKQAAGFQWQNPAAQKVHESEESKLVAQLIKDYLEFYRMDYTLSVYSPEIALQGQEQPSRDELSRRAGINSISQREPLLVQMLKQVKQQQATAPLTQAKPAAAVQRKPEDARKAAYYQAPVEEDDIKEDIDIEEDQHVLRVQEIDAGITASASLGID